jgi:hypothetical protein
MKPWLNLLTLLELVHQGFRHGFTGLASVWRSWRRPGGLGGPVLVELAGEFHQVARHVGAGEVGVLLLAEQAVQGVAEFVEGMVVTSSKLSKRGLPGGGLSAR